MIIIDDVFLGRAALGAQRPIVIKLSRGRSVDASVCPVLCGKMADRIIGQTGPEMRQVVRFGDQSTGRGTFGGEFGACHCNQVCDSAATRPSSQITLGRLVEISQTLT